MGFNTPNRSITMGLGVNKVLLHYEGEKQVELPVSEDYKTAREQIFGEGGFLKDNPNIKASEMISDKKRIKYYVTPEEIMYDMIGTVFPREVRTYMMGALKDASLTLITNAFQKLSINDVEGAKECINDLNNTIQGYIDRTRRKYRYAYYYVGIIPEESVYYVECTLLNTEGHE